MDSRKEILEYLEDCPDDIKQYIDGVLDDIESIVSDATKECDELYNSELCTRDLYMVEAVNDKLTELASKLY